MKRKPILFEKVARTKRCKGREVIGLIGTHHGVGVTHTGLMLSFYMGEELGKKSAFLECNRHHDMTYIQNAYDWSTVDEDSFSFGRTTCYPEVMGGQITRIFSDEYESIIMDFGVDFMANKDEFLRCTTKIVIGGRSEWDLQKLHTFSNFVQTVRGSESWMYFIPQAKHKTITKIRNEIKRNVLAVPTNDEPVLPSREINRFFSSVF
jgi:hypothetical protein